MSQTSHKHQPTYWQYHMHRRGDCVCRHCGKPVVQRHTPLSMMLTVVGFLLLVGFFVGIFTLGFNPLLLIVLLAGGLLLDWAPYRFGTFDLDTRAVRYDLYRRLQR